MQNTFVVVAPIHVFLACLDNQNTWEYGRYFMRLGDRMEQVQRLRPDNVNFFFCARESIGRGSVEDFPERLSAALNGNMTKSREVLNYSNRKAQWTAHALLCFIACFFSSSWLSTLQYGGWLHNRYSGSETFLYSLMLPDLFSSNPAYISCV